MPPCPHCGAEVPTGTNFCQACGAELTPEAPADERGQPDRGPRGEPAEGTPQPGPGTGTGEAGGQGSPHSGAHRPPQAGSGGGITRRHLLAGGGALAVAGAAGWYFFLREDRGPAETVEALYASINDGNYDRAMTMIHAEGPVNETVSRSSLERSSTQVQITGTEVIEQSDGRASVRVTVTSEQMSGEQTYIFELRTAGGEWKVWDTTAGTGTEPAQMAPQVNFTFDLATGSGSDVLTITHTGGDELTGSELMVTIDGAASTPADGQYDWTALGGPSSVMAGDQLTVDRASLSAAGAPIDGDLDLSGATVRVVWNGGEQSAVLGEFEVPA